MPTFDTPEPISVKIELAFGTATILASDRDDTIVEVRPSNNAREADIKTAEQTRVEYSKGRLLIKAPKQRILLGRGGSIDVAISLPEDSELRGSAAATEIHGEGRLGKCTFDVASGAIRLDHAAELRLNAASGHVSVNRAVGRVDVVAASGQVRIGELIGTALIKNASGDTRVGALRGADSALRVQTASGDIGVDHAEGTVNAKTATGHIKLGEAVSGSVVLETASGDVEVGVREGTAAWLELRSLSGQIRNNLDAAAGPEQSDATLEVRAHTFSGNIAIGRTRLRTDPVRAGRS
ncbi:MAG: DUF4097 family beta strand repeat-containing protein [Mycobacteriales bacterium]